MISAEDCIRYCAMEFSCPHCETKLSPCEVPPFHIGDGLGWGTEVFFVCLNDECPPFVRGWEYIEEQFGHVGSYRYMRLPNEKKGDMMMVGNKMAFTGSILDPEAILAANSRHQQERAWVAEFDQSVIDKNTEPALGVLLDARANKEHRKKACDTLLKINDISCYDAVSNLDDLNPELENATNILMKELLKKNFMRTCPDCAEIIKLKAGVCKHCKKKFD